MKCCPGMDDELESTTVYDFAVESHRLDCYQCYRHASAAPRGFFILFNNMAAALAGADIDADSPVSVDHGNAASIAIDSIQHDLYGIDAE